MFVIRFQPYLIALAIAVTIAIYWPGLHGGFIFDDFANIVDNSRLKIQDLTPGELVRAADSGTAGPTKRPLSMISFALNFYFGGLSPFFYKLTNLIIHVLNGLLIFVLARACLEGSGRVSREKAITIALATSAAWLLHPLNLTSVLYVVQRMSSLSTLFTLLALYSYVYVRLGKFKSDSVFLAIGALTIFAALATLSKENGVLTFAYALIIEICFLKFLTKDRVRGKLLVAFFAIVVLLGIGTNLLVFTAWKGWLDEIYISRDFTLSERLLTESRAVLFYLKMLFLPNISELGLYHDDFTVSKSLFDPPTTFVSLIIITVLLVIAITLRNRAAMLSFAVLWYMTGHVVESTYLPLELVHEHRTYLANFGPLFLVCMILFSPPKDLLTPASWRYLGIGFLSVLALVTLIRSGQWENPVIHAALEAENHPESYRANYEIGMMLVVHNRDKVPEYYDRAAWHFKKATAIASHRQKALFATLQTSFIRGEEPDASIVETLIQRLRAEPFQSAEVLDFEAFVKCVKKQVCKVDEQVVQAIFGAVLKNPTVHSKAKARLWNIHGIYVAEVLGNYDEAWRSFQRAVEVHPSELPYRANAIRMLIATGDKQAAVAELNYMRRLDKWGRMETSFLELQELIDAL